MAFTELLYKIAQKYSASSIAVKQSIAGPLAFSSNHQRSIYDLDTLTYGMTYDAQTLLSDEECIKIIN